MKQEVAPSNDVLDPSEMILSQSWTSQSKWLQRLYFFLDFSPHLVQFYEVASILLCYILDVVDDEEDYSTSEYESLSDSSVDVDDSTDIPTLAQTNIEVRGHRSLFIQ